MTRVNMGTQHIYRGILGIQCDKRKHGYTGYIGVHRVYRIYKGMRLRVLLNR